MCIDPQQQALNWIKKKEEKNNLKVRKDLMLIDVLGWLFYAASHYWQPLYHQIRQTEVYGMQTWKCDHQFCPRSHLSMILTSWNN